jgi:glycosyltransferase involved in cell wall biosynthesis
VQKSLRVALPTAAFLPKFGGVEVGLHNIASRLQKMGHRPTLLVPARFVKSAQEVGFKPPYPVVGMPTKVFEVFIRWPWLGFQIMDRFFNRMQKQHQFDVWHATMGYPIGVCLMHYFAGYPAVPNLVRCVGDDIQLMPEIGYGMRQDQTIDGLVRRWLPESDRLIAISESVAQEYRSLEVPEERIAHIPNGVDLARFNEVNDLALARQKLGISADEFVFLSVGRNHSKKNFAGILRAAAILKQETTARFVVVIVGRDVPELSSYAAELGIADIVRLENQFSAADWSSGNVDVPSSELVSLYQASDCFVFPSHVETFGIVIVEAMAAGLPIITSDGPGCRDLVDGGKYGLQVGANDHAALAANMKRVLEDQDLYADYAARASDRAQAYSWDVVVEKYVGLYRQMIAEANNVDQR